LKKNEKSKQKKSQRNAHHNSDENSTGSSEDKAEYEEGAIQSRRHRDRVTIRSYCEKTVSCGQFCKTQSNQELKHISLETVDIACNYGQRSLKVVKNSQVFAVLDDKLSISLNLQFLFEMSKDSFDKLIDSELGMEKFLQSLRGSLPQSMLKMEERLEKMVCSMVSICWKGYYSLDYDNDGRVSTQDCLDTCRSGMESVRNVSISSIYDYVHESKLSFYRVAIDFMNEDLKNDQGFHVEL